MFRIIVSHASKSSRLEALGLPSQVFPESHLFLLIGDSVHANDAT